AGGGGRETKSIGQESGDWLLVIGGGGSTTTDHLQPITDEKDPSSQMSPDGERGIRTLDTGLTPYNGLANRRLQPLGHLSNVRVAQSRPCDVAAQHVGRRSGATRSHPR